MISFATLQSQLSVFLPTQCKIMRWDVMFWFYFQYLYLFYLFLSLLCSHNAQLWKLPHTNMTFQHYQKCFQAVICFLVSNRPLYKRSESVRWQDGTGVWTFVDMVCVWPSPRRFEKQQLAANSKKEKSNRKCLQNGETALQAEDEINHHLTGR